MVDEAQKILAARREIIQKYGPWTAHDIHLGAGIYTINGKNPGPYSRVNTVLRLVSGALQRPLKELRILDLACLEGAFSIEFGLRGATVVGLEGRSSNVQKAIFTRDTLDLNNVEFYQDDVRNISAAKYGNFDVILCLGILYHLNATSLFPLLRAMAGMSTGITIVETTLAFDNKEYFEHNDKRYFGNSIREHPESTTDERRALDRIRPGSEQKAWSSLDNEYSFWPSRSSLINMFADAGFGALMECLYPGRPSIKNRGIFVAYAGDEIRPLYANELLDRVESDFYPEEENRNINRGNQTKLRNPETTKL